MKKSNAKKSELDFEARDSRMNEILFSAHKKFIVPRYQRPYAWTEDQISDFWTDLSDDYTNFIGSFIFNKENFDKTGRFEIIDGQQRLLTITILSAVLRNIAKEYDEKTATFFHRKDIVIEEVDGNEVARIKCGESIQAFFADNIQAFDSNILTITPSSKEEKLIKNCYKYFNDKIVNKLKDIPENTKRLEYIKTLRGKLLHLPVIQIEIGHEDDAYDIFETTNARGLDLSIADLLKNMIFNKLRGTDEKDLAKEYWNEIVSNIQETGTELKKFIRYYWISKYSFVSEKKLYKTIKNKITDIEELLFDLHNASEWYNKLVIGNLDAWDEVNSGSKIYKSLRALQHMKVSQCYVLFLSILRNLDKLGTNPQRIFEWIENFSFKYSTVCKLPGNKLEKLYSRYARKIEEIAGTGIQKNRAKNIQILFEQLLNELKEQEPGIEQFKEAFAELSYGKSENSRTIIMYTLMKINSIYQDSEFDFSTVNIEHILPQKPSKDWKLKQKDIKSYVNKLGNLTILHKKINSIVGNKLVKDKTVEYSSSGVSITIQLLEKIKELNYLWNEEKINERHVELADLAYKQAWALKKS